MWPHQVRERQLSLQVNEFYKGKISCSRNIQPVQQFAHGRSDKKKDKRAAADDRYDHVNKKEKMMYYL